MLILILVNFIILKFIFDISLKSAVVLAFVNIIVFLFSAISLAFFMAVVCEYVFIYYHTLYYTILFHSTIYASYYLECKFFGKSDLCFWRANYGFFVFIVSSLVI